MRNILEYTKGEADTSYIKLTSLLHCKADTNSITIGDLDAIYDLVFGHTSTPSPNANDSVIDLINSEAQDCLIAANGFNFENKIVLAVAIRLTAERFMIDKINDPAFIGSITHNQAHKLFSCFRGTFPLEAASIQVLHKVNLMTPENIHLNSFMYEPILDMSDEHLRRLYKDVRGLA